MRVYIYAAALLCEDCGKAQRDALDAVGLRPEDVEDESTYDSDRYPKGPFADGGGWADSPQHCDHCGAFLDNPLTGDGVAYVESAFRAFLLNGSGLPDVVEEWAEAYGPVYAVYAADRVRDECARLRRERGAESFLNQ